MGRTGGEKKGGKGKTTTERRKWERERRWKLRKTDVRGIPRIIYVLLQTSLGKFPLYQTAKIRLTGKERFDTQK